MFHRAYSVLAVRDVDDTTRVIRGVATTPTPDRAGDVIEPLGIAFKNPLPLLWQHDAKQPVGRVEFDAPTKDGVTFKATLPVVTEPGTLKDRIDEAYQSLQHQLVRGVSVGFALRGPAKDAVELLASGGIRFKSTEVLELSLVTIPANAEALISTIKSADVGATIGTDTDTLRARLQAGATAVPRGGIPIPRGARLQVPRS